MESKALLGIVLFPLLGAVANGFLGRGANKEWQASRGTVHAVACLSVAASFLLTVYCFVWQLVPLHSAAPEGHNATLSYTAYEWFSISLRGRAVPVQVRFVMDALSGVMCLIVSGIGLLIHLYSTGYMSEEKSYARFFAYMNLFTASMLILVLGSNLPLMFVGWEGVGLCSYLLIGFWWETPAYAAAGRKAFVANRIGDFGVVIGMLLLVGAVGSFEFADINAHAAALTHPIVLPGLTLAVPVATAATLFLFLGCTGKSAQIPLYVWLPDAMAGPTPVSALIHAATMVTSGLYLICRLSPVFSVAPLTMAVVAVTGALTALLAATIGCVQNEIKKVLAYSTVSQLGFMFAAVGCGAFAAGFFQVFTHAFFKACLFLGAGSVMHAVGAHGDADIRRLGGLRKYLPRTHWTFLVSCLAISGVPGFSGFFSKDEILVGALSVGDYFPAGLGEAVFLILVIAAIMTAFYMFRLYFMTFGLEYRGGPEHAHHEAPAHDGDDEHTHGHGEPHESPDSMTVPLAFLGVGAIGAGWLWLGFLGLFGARFSPWLDWLEPSLGRIGEEHTDTAVTVEAMLGGLTAVVVGIGLAYAWYGRPAVETPRRLAERFPRLYALVLDKWRVDELYESTVLAASRGLGLVSAGIDKVVVDGLLAKLTAYAVQGLGFVFTRMQNGLVQAYGAVMVVGVLGLTYWFVVPHPEVQVPEPPGGDAVDFVAQPGVGYEYRWDFDDDGNFDTAWSEDGKASHTYDDKELRPGAVAVFEPAVYAAGLRHTRLALGQRLTLDPADLGPGWQRDDGNDTPPVVEATKDGLLVRPNGARLQRDGKTLSDPQLLLVRGQHVDVGQARLTAAGIARGQIRVRSAFGVEREGSYEVELPVVAERPAVEVVGMAEAGR